ncbi:putative holin-like toxin [Anaerosporobacter sp.]
MTVFEAISLMISFGIFVIAFITLVVELMKLFHNKK